MAAQADIARLIEAADRARHEDRARDAQRDLEGAVALARQAGLGAELADALRDLGRIERDLVPGGARSMACYREAADLNRALERPVELAHCLRHQGELHRKFGAPEAAAADYRAALALYRAHPPQTLHIANACRGLALAAEAMGQRDAARAFWSEAGAGYADAGVAQGVANAASRIEALGGR